MLLGMLMEEVCMLKLTYWLSHCWLLRQTCTIRHCQTSNDILTDMIRCLLSLMKLELTKCHLMMYYSNGKCRQKNPNKIRFRNLKLTHCSIPVMRLVCKSMNHYQTNRFRIPRMAENNLSLRNLRIPNKVHHSSCWKFYKNKIHNPNRSWNRSRLKGVDNNL